MKIALVCSSLEPGLDGIGDYCRSLGAEFAKHGNEVLLVSFNDRNGDSQLTDKSCHNLREIRFAPNRLNVPRIQDIQRELANFSTDWVIFQYNPYGFSVRGNPLGIPVAVISILWGISNVAVYVHELAAGQNMTDRLRLKLLGNVQRWIFAAIIKVLSPSRVLTSNWVYQWQLSRLGLASTVIPLFSNIEPLEGVSSGCPEMRMQADVFIVALFGKMHESAGLEDGLAEALSLARADGRSLTLQVIGNVGDPGRILRWRNSLGDPSVLVEITGILPSQDVARRLHMASLAIVQTPVEYLGKSGVFAAFRRFGLPVLVPGRAGIQAVPEAVVSSQLDLLMAKNEEFWTVRRHAEAILAAL